MTHRRTFEAPYNWCDRHCERCALYNLCPVSLRTVRRGTRLEEDPDAWTATMDMEDVYSDLQHILAMLRRTAANEGTDPSLASPPEPVALDAERLERAAFQLVRRIGRLGVSCESEPSPALECFQLSVQLAAKIARVTSYLADGFVEACAGDAVPNLILIERTCVRLRHALTAFDDTQKAGAIVALRQLELLLAPLLETVDDAARAYLGELICTGCAPSPFLIAAPPCA